MTANGNVQDKEQTTWCDKGTTISLIAAAIIENMQIRFYGCLYINY